MLPILPFVAGIVIGASALRVYRRAKASPRLGKAVEAAGQKIRETAVSGLEGIQRTSARLQTRLTAPPAEIPPAADAGKPESPEPGPAPTARGRSRAAGAEKEST
jgi:hypothetical protein